jgi:hypothetical protein
MVKILPTPPAARQAAILMTSLRISLRSIVSSSLRSQLFQDYNRLRLPRGYPCGLLWGVAVGLGQNPIALPEAALDTQTGQPWWLPRFIARLRI